MKIKFFFGTNLKMYKTIEETKQYLQELIALTKDIDGIYLFVIPSFPCLEAARRVTEGSHVHIGAQNMHWEEEGQFTGEVSPKMLREIPVEIIEIGHSERRHIFNETNEEENKKVRAAVKNNFTPLLCVGETASEKNFDVADEVLKMQLKIGFHNVDGDNLFVAYEPVWAIGVQGVPAPAEYVYERHQTIKNTMAQLFPQKSIPLFYGGSVNIDNAKDYAHLDNVDGLFVGRAAWDAKNFNRLIRDVLRSIL